MKASELRIGNLVEIEGSITTVETLGDEGINFDVNYGEYGGIEYEGYYGKRVWSSRSVIDPIPISEEWLKKFGFKQDRSVWERPLKKEINDSPSNIQTWRDSNEFQICRVGIYATSVKCDYVHQLQNLYFALTGEELDLKL